MDLRTNKIGIFVIGAGISGIACANRLLELNKDYAVTILEASDRYGGRLRTLKNFTNFDIELGGEEIHGSNSLYYELVKKSGGNPFGYWDQNIIYTSFNGKLCSFENSNIPEVKKVEDLFEEVSYQFKEEFEDITLRDYLIKNKFSEDVYHLANAMIGVEAGTDLDSISIGGFSKVCKLWKAGEDNFLITNMSHVEIIEKAFPAAINNIILNCVINKISLTKENEVVISDKDNNIYCGNKCVLTVPITQLKNNSIEFCPPFNEEKTKAINSIKMDSCAKLILKLKKSFWPENTCWLLLKGNVNCYWPTAQGKNSNEIVLSALVTGRGCDNLRNLYKEDRNKFIANVIEDLESGFNLTDLKNDLIDYFWFDWASTPFIEGGYTYASVGEGESRDIAKLPINNTIYFGGEAFARNGHYATIHGAIESGIEAAEELHRYYCQSIMSNETPIKTHNIPKATPTKTTPRKHETSEQKHKKEDEINETPKKEKASVCKVIHVHQDEDDEDGADNNKEKKKVVTKREVSSRKVRSVSNDEFSKYENMLNTKKTRTKK